MIKRFCDQCEKEVDADTTLSINTTESSKVVISNNLENRALVHKCSTEINICSAECLTSFLFK